MARLDSIPAARQYAAIAYLRSRLFLNGFRRKGGGGELVARILVLPVAALFVIGPVVGAGLGSYALISSHRPQFLSGIFFGIFILQIIVSINIGPPGLSFDPESLIRFPLTFTRYLAIRLFLGLLSVSTVVGTLALLAAATGATVATPAIAPVAFGAAIALAIANMLLVRMVFAWVDRWLSTRRARELFTVLIFVFSIGIQYINVTVNNVGRHSSEAEQTARYQAFANAYSHVAPLVRYLPPGLAAQSLLSALAERNTQAVLAIAGILLFALLFLAIFAWRMQREYRGENLSQAAMPVPTPAVPHAPQLRREESAVPQRAGLVPPIVSACYRKEWIYVRRNPAQFYGLIAPLAMVFLFAGRLGAVARSGLIFPAAVAYSVLGIAALAYNILGLDASGVQFYFIAPIPLRSVVLGKNLFGFSITAVQVTLVYVVLLFTAGRPPVVIAVSTLCWVVFACLVNATVGNMRSVTAPRKVDPNKISRKQVSQLSGLLCVGLMLVMGGIGFALISLSRLLHLPWLPIPVLAAFAAGAFALYSASLASIDRMALQHRETLMEELSKAS